MQEEHPRFPRFVARLRQKTRRPAPALFFIIAIAALWLGSVIAGPVLSAGGASPATAPQAGGKTNEVWQDISTSSLQNRTAEGVPASARALKLNADALTAVLKATPMEFTAEAADSRAVLEVPMPDGKFERFRLVESPIMQPGFLKQFPEIKSYSGQGIDNPRLTMRCDYSPRGFNTLVLSEGKAVSVHPARWDDTTTYVSYYGQDFKGDNAKSFCGVDAAEELKAERWMKTGQLTPVPAASGATLRQYRLALAVTQEYYNQPSLGGGTLANAVASLNTWLNAVDAVYEREFSERMILVDNTSIIFTAEPDGLTNGDKNTEIDQVKVILQNQVGLANYDVGHLLSYVAGGGGLAGVGVVCSSDNNKGRGVTEVGGPNANFDGVHVFSHELGHQHGATHSWNGCTGSADQRANTTAYEVGSGFTIMSYGGVCTTDNIVPFRSNTELRFHVGTYEQVNNYIATTACATTSSTGNHPPTVDAGTNYVIPKQTPFMLTASASDADAGDVANLTYCWEELDSGGSAYGNPPYDDSGDPATTTRPIFRAYSPTTSPSRLFPALTYILNYANDPPDTIGSPAVRPGEELPRIGRTLNFRVTARDNRSGGGGVSNDAMVVTVDGSSGPFLVTAPNTAVSWTGGSTQTVTWSVNNTNNAPISCANVKLTLSTDGGNTFPITLAASTANDGSESITVPSNIQTTTARIKVQAIGNIFFDIDDASFTITPGGTCPVATDESPLAGLVSSTVTITGVNFTGVTAVKFANNVAASFTVDSATQITATVPTGAVNGPITLSKSGCADYQTTTFSVCSGTSSTLQVDNTLTNIHVAPYFVNRLTPASYPATLTHISIYWYGSSSGGPALNTPLTLLAGTNTDGDSNINNTSFQMTSATVKNQFAFTTYAITPITISSGDFVVGFYMDTSLSTYQASSDNTSPDNRSYYSSNGTSFNLDTGYDYKIRAQMLTGCCTYSISPSAQDFLASGGSGSVGVNTGCPWTAASNDSWITITSGASGSGNGTVTYSVATNSTGATRTGTMTIAGQTFTVTQAACAYSISPTSQSFTGAGTGSVTVTSPSGCAWTAASNDSWITITSGASGTGDGTVNYSVAANNTGSARTGTLTVAGQTFTVTEAACTFSISPASRSHDAGAGGGTVAVTTGGGCNWTATSNAAWITVNSACSGSPTTLAVDDGNLTNIHTAPYFVNRLTPASYPATLTQVSVYWYGGNGGPAVNTPLTIIAGTNTDGDSNINNSITQSVSATVQSQWAFNTYDIAPMTITSGDFVVGFYMNTSLSTYQASSESTDPDHSRSYYSTDGLSFNLDASYDYMIRGSYFAGCAASSATGSGTAIYSVAANNTGSSRSGTMTIAGQTFTVNQAACVGTISPASRSHDAGAGGGTVSVSASSCTWSATSNASWLTVVNACSSSPSSLVIDTGSITNTRGSGAYYVNRLTPASYPATLTQVAIYWYGANGNPPTGTPLTLLVGNNADGDTNINGTSFQATSATVGSLFQFNTYDIPPVTITSGDFVIGFFMAADAGITRALAMEQTDPDNGRSYLSGDGKDFTLDPAFDYMIRGTYFGGCSTTSAAGNGTISYLVAANNSGAQRTGTLTIAGQTFTVTQATCTSPATYYADADGDGYGNPSVSVSACNQPAGYVANNLDCDDTRAAVNPAAREVCNNGLDDNCDGLTDQYVNNALDFDGTNDNVKLPYFDRPTTMTIEVWVKTTANADNTQRNILSWTGNYSVTTHTVEFYSYNGYVSYGEWTGTWLGTGGWYIGDGNWHHVAVVRNGNGTNNTSIYVDGVLKQTVTVNYTVTTSDLRLGCINWDGINNNDRFFKGSIDELRIWNVARTQAQIQANMNKQLAGNESGLLRYYPFDRGAAGGNNSPFTSLTEYTANAAHGALNNFALSGATSNYVAGSPAATTCAPPGTLQFASAPYTDSETNADHNVTINVSRTGGSGGTVAVNYAVTDGTATAGSDYTVAPASGTLTWADGDTASKTITITVKGDTVLEGDETVNLALSSPTGGATLGTPSTTTLTITNDDIRDIRMTSVTVCQPASPYTATTPVLGEQVFVKVIFQTDNLLSGASYRLQATMDGVSINQTNVTSGAGGAGTSEWTYLWGGWFATSGAHTITVTLDADNSVSEGNESNNSTSVNFTTAAPTTLPNKLLNPLGGTPFKDWSVINYVDVNPASVTFNDYLGGTFAYDAHNGHDLTLANFARMDTGIPIYAAAAGTVTQTSDGNFDRNRVGAGQPANYVVVSQGNGWEIQYYHLVMRSVAVKVGQTVSAGQLIGLAGSSGNSSDAHLHFGLYHNGALVEPMQSPTDYFSSPFAYQGTLTPSILDIGMVNYSPGDYKERPAEIKTFSTQTPQNPTVWFRWTHLPAGTQYQVKWYRPNGTLATTFSNTPPSSMERYGIHAWAIAASALNGNLGAWRVAVEISGTEVGSTTFQATSGVGDPGIEVLDGSTYITDNRTTPIDFGSAAQNAAAVAKPFTVHNHGTAALHLSNLLLPAGFVLNGSLPATIAANASATFTVNLTTATVGSKFGALRLTTDDPEATSFDFNISGTITGTPPAGAPVITLSGAALAYMSACQAAVIDSQATVSDSDSANLNGGSLTVSFSTVSALADQLGIRNAGNGAGQIGTSGATVTYGGVAIATFAGGTNGTPLTVSFNSSATPAAVQELVRNITFKTTVGNPATLIRYVLFSLSDGSNISNQAVGAVVTDKLAISDINVMGNGVAIADGNATPSATDGTDFGSAFVSGDAPTRSYTIQNTGTADLTISAISFSGANQSEFSFSGINLPATVSAGSSTTLTITFDPSATGTRTATVNIASNDCDEGVYDFALQGTGVTGSGCSSNSGNWNASATWGCGHVPTAGDNIVIRSGQNVMLNVDPAALSGITIESGATLTVMGNHTLASNLTVNGTLDLTNGKLDTGANTLNIGCAGTVTGVSSSTYIQGNVKKSYCATGSFTFPVGTASGYSPVDVNITSGTGDFTVKAVEGAQPNLLGPAYALHRYWTLAATGLTANLTFHYLQADVPASANESSFLIIKYEGSFTFPGGSVDATANTATLNNVSTFSDWTLGQPSAPTEVDLIDFNARVDAAGHVLLEWQTGYEVNNLGFHIYREQAGRETRLTPSPVAGSALLAGETPLTAGFSYAWVDVVTDTKSAALYWLEDIDLSGKVTRHGPVSPLPVAELPEQAQSLLLSQLHLGAKEFGAQQQPLTASRAPQIDGSSLKNQWQIVAQPGVKLLINHSGWYRVTQPQLVAAGLDVSREPRLLQLFVDGHEVAMLVNGGSKGRLEPTDSIEFFASGIDTNEAAAHAYYLVNGAQPGRRIAPFAGAPAKPSTAQNFVYTTALKPRVFYFPSLLNGDADNWFGPVISPTAYDLTIKAAHPDLGSSQPATLEVVLQGLTNNFTHRVNVSVNGTLLGAVQFDGQTHPTFNFTLPAALLREGDNQITVQSVSGASDFSLVDSLRLTYAHRFVADTNSLPLTAEGGSTIQVSGFAQAAVRLVDLTDADNPIEIQGTVEAESGGSYRLLARLPASGARQLYAFNERAIESPLQISPQRPSRWNRPENGANLVIVTHQRFIASLEPLKSLRQSQGYSVAVVDVEDIYDEFSYGAHAAAAVRDFLNRATTLWKKAPQWVLLVGDASSDPRDYLGLGDNDLVPTGRIATLQMETASDEWLGDRNGDGLSEVAIGRLPVRTEADAVRLVRKIISYNSTRHEGALLVSDRPDGYDFEGATAAIRNLLPAGMVVTEVYRSRMDDPTAHQAVMAGINRGPMLVNYAGHGSMGVWRGNLLVTNDTTGLINRESLSVVISMTCLNALFNDSRAMSLSEAMMLGEGGAVAVWASSAQSSPGDQARMNQEVVRQLFGSRTDKLFGITLGEATKRARLVVMDGDVRRSWVLLGDPMLRVK